MSPLNAADPQKLFIYRFDHPAQELSQFLQDRYQLKGDVLVEALERRITVNGSRPAPGFEVQTGDQIEFLHLRSDEAAFEGTPLPLLYEDEDLLAISKPANLPVSPSGRYYFHSLAILARERFDEPDLSPLHRLDLETSGVLLFGRNRRARSKVQQLFAKQDMDKTYEAITLAPVALGPISGDMIPAEGSKIYSKQVLIPSRKPLSLSIVEACEPWGPYFKVQIKPVTGKTNQLRVHLAAKGAPILGDKKYHPDESVYLEWFENRNIQALLDRLVLPRQALHCARLAFNNPLTGNYLEINDHSPGWPALINPLKDL
ncbi:MAG: RluA family pseudouridine synthase [bacterium]|nr:RluA family pseudouridine synthase [bacterium]